MRFVPIKTDDQLDLQALHRVRQRLVRRRTALINQIRGFLLERGLVFAKRPANLRRHMPLVLEDADANLTPRLRRLLADLWEEWKQVQADIASLDEEMEHISVTDAACQRLREIPGVGPLVATAMVAAIGNGAAFGNGREFVAWLGLVPKQYSTGGRTRLFGISKRGNTYLRCIFIHGARALLWRVKDNGHSNCGCELHQTLWQSHWPTSWRVSPGPYSAAVSTIASRPRLPLPEAPRWKRSLRLENACAFPTFPPHHGDSNLDLFKVCKKNYGMKQQSNGVPENLMLRMVEKTDGFIRTGTRGSSLCARSYCSN